MTPKDLTVDDWDDLVNIAESIQGEPRSWIVDKKRCDDVKRHYLYNAPIKGIRDLKDILEEAFRIPFEKIPLLITKSNLTLKVVFLFRLRKGC